MKQELFKGTHSFYGIDRKAWRNWLYKNHATEKNVWLILYSKNTSKTSPSWDEAVEEALCFGWIDSTTYKRDAESRYQFFCPRKPKGNWSSRNKDTVTRLIAEGQMKEAGMKMIDLAKATGTWDALNDVEQEKIPDDLMKLFLKNKTALKNFEAFPKSARRGILGWIHQAKRAETRSARMDETIRLAKDNIRANQPLKK